MTALWRYDVAGVVTAHLKHSQHYLLKCIHGDGSPQQVRPYPIQEGSVCSDSLSAQMINNSNDTEGTWCVRLRRTHS